MTDTILGYYRNREPITPPKPGMIYTQAFIICSICNHAIRHVGGPAFGSICVPCYAE